MALKTNEGTVCDAAVRYLERRENIERAEVWRPEEEKDGEVELAWKLGDQQYVIEHTVIEPFEDFLRMNAQAANQFEPIAKACEGLTSDVLEVEVLARGMQDLDKAAVAKAQAALIDYVRAIAPTLQLRRYSDYIGADKPVSIKDVPFPVRLFRFQNLGSTPRLQFKHIAPDLKKERPERIERACGAKFPKLAVWKEKGARTILVLEDNDIQLTNPNTVAEVFVPIARARRDCPDETYMVASCMEPWQLWPILVEDRSYFDLANQGLAGNVPFEEAKLDWITRKRGK